jgi:hypothetical protein
MADNISKSQAIRALAREGVSTAEIARRLRIRYQHAYSVLKAAGAQTGASREPKQVPAPKPPLSVGMLMAAGFQRAGQWKLSATSELVPDGPLPKDVGVYAFAKNDTVQYVGVATMGIAKRLYFYGKPGPAQITNKRLNAIIKDELQNESRVDIYVAVPPDFVWNGLPVHGSAGLEMGLIKRFALPWNRRSAG